MRKIVAICLVILLAGCRQRDAIDIIHCNTTKPVEHIKLDEGYEVINGSVSIDYQKGIGTFKIRKMQDE